MQGLRIFNGTVLTMDQDAGLIENGLVLTEGPHITYCGPVQGAPDAGGDRREINAAGGLIMPGLINNHTHAAMTLFRGLADDLPLQEWLEKHIFPAEQSLTAEAVYWGTMLAAAEMIRNGVTSFCDMYLFAPQVARAVEASGLRAVVGEVIYDFTSPGYGELEAGFALTEELIKRYADHPRISAAIMPHALYTCSPSLLTRAGEMAASLGADINIHVAENPAETAQVEERYGKRPLAHLADLGLLNRRLWVDHAVDVNPEEIAQMAEAGVRVAHCPESNMKLASGVAPLPALLAAGVPVGLGTDGCASNNDLDLFGEMDTCAKLHKVASGDPTVASAKEVLAMATSMGARVFGRSDLGVLAVGNLADIIVINTDQPHLTPMYDPASHLVYAARGGDVSHTVVHGEVLLEAGRIETFDEAEVLAKAREAGAKLNGKKS